MDGFLLVLWAVRLLFLGLIYLFLVPRRPRPAARPAGGGPRADRATRPAGRPRVAER